MILTKELSSTDSMLATIADPQRAPEMLAVRESIRGWRFYEGFRTEQDAPVRIPQVGTFTPVLSNEGTDLPAALETIRLFGDREALDRTVDDAFPGSRVAVEEQAGGSRCSCGNMGCCGRFRPRSFPTARCGYLLWTAALLTPRPPELMVLNEPETSLHPDLLPALARLIVFAAARTQIVVVSHAPAAHPGAGGERGGAGGCTWRSRLAKRCLRARRNSTRPSGSGRCVEDASPGCQDRLALHVLEPFAFAAVYSHPCMKRILTALILAPLVLALVFLGPKWLITRSLPHGRGAGRLGVPGAGGEMRRQAATHRRGGHRCCLFAVNLSSAPDQTLMLFCGLCVALLVYCTFRFTGGAGPDGRHGIDVRPGLSRAHADSRCRCCAKPRNGPSLVVFLFLTVWAGDTVALYVGRMLGQRKTGADAQPQQDMGGSDRFGCRAACCGRVCCWAWLLSGAVELREAVVCR